MARSIRSSGGRPGSSSVFLSPGFRSAAEMAGWDEEALLHATLVVEDTPVRESRQHKQQKRPRSQLKTPPQSSNSSSSSRKRKARRQSTASISPLVLRLDEDEEEEEQPAKKGPAAVRVDKIQTIAIDEEIEKNGSTTENASSKGLPCMDRLREELSCAICLEICYKPSTTPCGHSFCIKCLKRAAEKCGKRCPKCRQLISNGRSCTVNTVLWNTIQLLFPEEVEARKKSKININNLSRRNARYHVASTRHLAEEERSFRRRGGRPSPSEDAALALRLQREEFMVAFQGHQHSLHSARESPRARTRY